METYYLKSQNTKIRLLPILMLFFMCVGAYSQIGFQDHIITDDSYNTDEARQVLTADLDGDGDKDVVSVSLNKVAWYENTNGTGEFGKQQTFINYVPGKISVFIIDIDGDNDLDILIATKTNNSISWYKNSDGLGDFVGQPVITWAANGVNSIFAGDLDNDGDNDIVAINESDENIVWYENIDGIGNFGTETIISENIYDRCSVYITDLDTDGDMDIVSSSENFLIWHENTNNAANFINHGIETYLDNFTSIIANDIDGDGDIDIVQSRGNSSYDNLVWYENFNSTNVFIKRTITDAAYYIGKIFLSDIDGDGDSDIIGYIGSIDSVFWYENINGQGDFSDIHLIPTDTNGPSSVWATDIDGDGDNDLLTSSFYDNKIAWYKNTGIGTFESLNLISHHADSPRSVVTADIDGDGDLDVISASSGDNKIAWYENIDGNGDFGIQQIVSSNTNGARSVHVTDIDGDSDMDILTASYNNAEITWYENINGLGDFGEKEIISSNADAPNCVYSSDLDGDGDMDVIAALYQTGKIAWYENIDGLGNFSDEQIISTNAGGVRSVFSTDIDGDGDLDVISASSGDNKIAWYENIDGVGNFSDKQIISSNTNAFSVYSSDLDGDGDMDVISAGWDNKIAWYKNIDGLGNFSTEIIISYNADRANSVFASDIDDDGDMDILSASSDDDKIAWYENLDGLGNFGIDQIIESNADAANCVYASDIDGDGDIDVLSTSVADDKIAWYENLGNVNNEISGIIHFDINADGCDTNDVSFPNQMVITTNGTESLASFTLANGYYQLFPDEGNFLTAVASSLPEYYNVDPLSFNSNFTGVGNIDTANFCVVANQTINDLNVNFFPKNNARPDFISTYQIVYENVGTTQISGNIALVYDETKVNFLFANETISNQTSNSLGFDFSNLNPFETRTIDVEFNVFTPPNVNIGNILVFNTTINPITDDYTTDDNVFTLNQVVVDSFDPNDITCLEGSQVLIEDADEYLHYIIRFQNTGTAPAIHVIVRNEIDVNLNWETLEIENISHINRIEIINGDRIKFIFENINLPDSTTNEPESHGYIAYKIKPKDDISLGDTISNNANIFFDFNPAIATNIATTQFVNFINVEEHSLFNFTIYPIPVNNTLSVISDSIISDIYIYNQLGQLVKSNKSNNTIDVSDLNQGVYIIKVRFNNEILSVKKIIKE